MSAPGAHCCHSLATATPVQSRLLGIFVMIGGGGGGGGVLYQGEWEMGTGVSAVCTI